MNRYDEIFAPFFNYGGYWQLALRDGKIIPSDEVLSEPYIQYHIDVCYGDIFEIGWNLNDGFNDGDCTNVYIGKIPSREYFLSILKNIDRSPYCSIFKHE